MPLSKLTQAERDIVQSCLRAAVEGPFFDDSEFHAIFGLSRNELADLLSRWPEIDDREGTDGYLGINSALNNLLGYPHGQGAVGSQYVTATPEEVSRVFAKWKGKPARAYFEELE